MEPSSPGGMEHSFVLYCLEFLKFVSAASQIMHDTLCVMCDSITRSFTNYLPEARPSSTAGVQTQTGCLANEALAEEQELKQSLERYLQNMENFIQELRNGRNQCNGLLDDSLLRKMDKANSVTIKLSFPQSKYSRKRRKSSLAADWDASNVDTSEAKSENFQREKKNWTVSEAAEEEITYNDLSRPSKVTNSRDKSRSLVETLVGRFDASAHKRWMKHNEKGTHHSDDSYQPAFEEDSMNVDNRRVTGTYETGTSSSPKQKKHKSRENEKEFSVQDEKESSITESRENAEGAITAGKKAAAILNLKLAMWKQSLSRIYEPICVADRELLSAPTDISVPLEEKSEECLVENSDEEREQNLQTTRINPVVSCIDVENQACNVESSDTTNSGRQLPKNGMHPYARLGKKKLVKDVAGKKRGSCSVQIPENDRGKPEAISSSNINVSHSTAMNPFSNIQSKAEICDQANILTEERHATDRDIRASAAKIKVTSQEFEILSSSCGKKVDQAAISIISLEEESAKVYPADQCATGEKPSGDESGRVKTMMNAVRNSLTLIRETRNLNQSGLCRTKALPLEAEKREAPILPVDSKKCNLNTDTSVRSKKGRTGFDKTLVIVSDGVKVAEVDSQDKEEGLNTEKKIPQEYSKGIPLRVRTPCSLIESAIRRKVSETSEQTIDESYTLIPIDSLVDAVVKDIRRFADMDDDKVELELRNTDVKRFIFMQEVLEKRMGMKKRADQLIKYTSQCKETETCPISVKELRFKPKTPDQISRLGRKYHCKPNENETSEKVKHCASEEGLKATVQLAKQGSENKAEKDAV